MTLILTCLTRDYVVQASDRRLTSTEGRKVIVRDEKSNKALIYGSSFVFAYTGLTYLPRITAIDWAAKRLQEKQNIGDAILHLGNSASDLMNSGPLRSFYSGHPESLKKLAFVGAGFPQLKVDGKPKGIVPMRIVVSNYFNSQEKTWLPQPRREFIVHYDWLSEDREFELFTAGQSLEENREARLNALLARCIQRKVKPESIGRLLTREIQAAARLNDRIGKNIMCTVLPRLEGELANRLTYRPGPLEMKLVGRSAESTQFEVNESISDQFRFVIIPPFDAPVFFYISSEGKTLPNYGPVLVGPGRVVEPQTILGLNVTAPPLVPTQPPPPPDGLTQ